jgi:hypothetical protein
VKSPGKVKQHITDLSRRLRPVTDAEKPRGGFDERRSMAHGPLSVCPGAGQRRIPTSRARMERVEKDQSRAESAGMGTRDDIDQSDSAKSKATEAQMQASSRAILTSRAQPEYRPCGVSVFTARLITDPAGKREDGLGRVPRGPDNPIP